MTGLIILISIYIMFRLTKHALQQGRRIEEQKKLIENMTKWEEKYKSDINNEYE